MNPATLRTLMCSLTLAVIISVIPSCKKDYDTNGTRLSKATTWYSAEPDRIYTYNFQYDALDRVTGIILSRKQFAVKNEPLFLNTIKFFYTASEMQPYKSVGLYRYDPRAERFYSYDNNGHVIIDSADITVANYMGLTKCEWSGDKVLRVTTTKLSNGSSNTRDSSTISNNNITGTYSGWPDGIYATGNTNTYDDKTNLLNTLNISSVFAIDGLYELFSPGYSKNNITMKIKGELYNGIYLNADTTTYTYQYNTAGLPVECEIKGRKATYKLAYYYAK